MPVRRAAARLLHARPVRRPDGSVAVALAFRPEGARLADHIEDEAELGPEATVPAVRGLGKVLRILRAGRVALPCSPMDLIGREDEAAALLQRAIGAEVQLVLQPRFRMRFQAWTEEGVITLDDVVDVREHEDEFVIRLRRSRLPRRVAREAVVRQRTEPERWHEVLAVERA